MIEKNWQQKEKRELFCKCVNTFIMKTGSDKDPIMEKVMEYAQMVVDKSFSTYPNEEEEGEEKDFAFPEKEKEKDGKK